MLFMGEEKSIEYQLVHMTSMMLFWALEKVIFLSELSLCWPMQRTTTSATTFTRHWIGKNVKFMCHNELCALDA